VTGLAAERRLAVGPLIETICSGGSPARLRASLDQLRPAYRAVISFGMAGGLDPVLVPGDVVLASGVLAGDKSWPTDPDILRAWVRRGPFGVRRVVQAEITGVEAPVLTSAEKARLHAATGGAVADMESHVAAAYAAAHGIPFAVLRAVCDPPDRTLPSLVTKALRPDGGVDLPGLLRLLLRRPHHMSALSRLARDSSAALTSLRRYSTLLGVGPGIAHCGYSLGSIP
jgi:hopanoid-associated phosphorylase